MSIDTQIAKLSKVKPTDYTVEQWKEVCDILHADMIAIHKTKAPEELKMKYNNLFSKCFDAYYLVKYGTQFV